MRLRKFQKLLLCVGIAALAMVLFGCPKDHPETFLNHFLCYEGNSDQPPPVEPDMKLRDQFDKSWRKARIEKVRAFCNPVAKRDDAKEWMIVDEKHHLTGYDIRVDGDGRDVMIDNQVTGYHWQEVELGKPLWLFTPAQKLYPREHPKAEGSDHFLCYKAEKDAEKGVSLRDQFLPEFTPAEVGRLRAFCNPAAKKHDGTEHPRIRPEAHLACYELALSFQPPPRVRYRDQFYPRGELHLKRPWALCVPSRKKLE